MASLGEDDVASHIVCSYCSLEISCKEATDLQHHYVTPLKMCRQAMIKLPSQQSRSLGCQEPRVVTLVML